MVYEFFICEKLVKVFTDAKEANDFVQQCYNAVKVNKITDEAIIFDLDVI